jgi:hypothetical protein
MRKKAAEEREKGLSAAQREALDGIEGSCSKEQQPFPFQRLILSFREV